MFQWLPNVIFCSHYLFAKESNPSDILEIFVHTQCSAGHKAAKIRHVTA